MSAVLSEAKRVLAALRGQDREHLKICSQCARAADGYGQLCDDGWELAKKLQAAKTRVADLTAGCGTEPVRLF